MSRRVERRKRKRHTDACRCHDRRRDGGGDAGLSFRSLRGVRFQCPPLCLSLVGEVGIDVRSGVVLASWDGLDLPCELMSLLFVRMVGDMVEEV